MKKLILILALIGCNEPIKHETKIEAMATEYIDESDVGWGEFVIVTQKGEKIRPGQVKLQKAVKVERTDKSVIYTSAWKALEEYFSELEHGMLTEN